jgi:hypothetical protein
MKVQVLRTHTYGRCSPDFTSACDSSASVLEDNLHHFVDSVTFACSLSVFAELCAFAHGGVALRKESGSSTKAVRAVAGVLRITEDPS